nr:MAG TPA: portal protein [Crassvirales sp.]
MMKPLSYFYDIVHYKLNEAIINNWGSIMTFDKAKVPDNMGLE